MSNKTNSSIETIINTPSRFEGDAYHYYRQTADSVLGDPDVVLDGIDSLTRIMKHSMPTAEDVGAAFLQLFAQDQSKVKV